MDLVTYAVPFFIIAMGVELCFGLAKGRNTYRVNDAVGSLFLGTLSQARRFVTLGVGGLVYHTVATQASLPQMDAANPWTWVIATVLYDFCYYWLHRLGHERSILWAAHVAHHQSEDYNLSTALRQTSTGFLLGWVFYLPMFALGIPAEVVVTVGSLNLIYQFWVHTEHIPKLGWYEWFFVTPSNHRVHHAQNSRYLDKNYGGLFILWDRLFGTFQEELGGDPPIYGIRGAIKSFSPYKALTHIYLDMARDSWRARRWGDKFRVWWSRTGWRPADLAESDPREKPALESFQRFDPSVSPWIKAYALFQLVVMVALLGILQLGAAVDRVDEIALVAVMFSSMVCGALWLDGQPQGVALRADVCRLVGIAAWVFLAEPVFAVANVEVLLIAYLVVNTVFLVRLMWLPLPRWRAAQTVDALSGPALRVQQNPHRPAHRD